MANVRASNVSQKQLLESSLKYKDQDKERQQQLQYDWSDERSANLKYKYIRKDDSSYKNCWNKCKKADKDAREEIEADLLKKEKERRISLMNLFDMMRCKGAFSVTKNDLIDLADVYKKDKQNV